MAKKIITFLSLKHNDAVEKDYICPDGSAVRGKETNEAPLRYLYRENPDIDEVICLVSDRAKAEAWEDFCLFAAENAPTAVCTEIHYDEQRDSGELLSEVMSKIQPDDVIFLDVTGGFRTVMMDIMLLSRTMHYTGVTFGGAVYSEAGRKDEPGHIRDATQLFDTFNMVEGMQELSSLGSTHMLRNYYDKRGEPDEKIDELLKSMDALFETITLCRTSKIDECMKRFEVALKNARSCDDPLMQQLLPTLQKRFGEGLDTLSLIEWCVKSNMLQQALTVYTERVPREIMRHVDGRGAYTMGKRDYEDADAIRLRELMMLSCDMSMDGRNNPVKSLRNYINFKRKDLLDVVYDNKGGEPYPNARSAVENLCIVLRATYPQEDGAFCENWRESIPINKGFLCYMDDLEWRYGVDRMLGKGMNESNLCKLFGADGYTMTLKNFRTLLPASDYRCIDCTETQLVDALKDYVYVKALRNMTNHANVESSSDQKIQMKYLNTNGYKVLEEVTSGDIRDILLKAVERVRNMRRK